VNYFLNMALKGLVFFIKIFLAGGSAQINKIFKKIFKKTCYVWFTQNLIQLKKFKFTNRKKLRFYKTKINC
jgi:hypothetical protein